MFFNDKTSFFHGQRSPLPNLHNYYTKWFLSELSTNIQLFSGRASDASYSASKCKNRNYNFDHILVYVDDRAMISVAFYSALRDASNDVKFIPKSIVYPFFIVYLKIYCLFRTLIVSSISFQTMFLVFILKISFILKFIVFLKYLSVFPDLLQNTSNVYPITFIFNTIIIKYRKMQNTKCKILNTKYGRIFANVAIIQNTDKNEENINKWTFFAISCPQKFSFINLYRQFAAVKIPRKNSLSFSNIGKW